MVIWKRIEAEEEGNVKYWFEKGKVTASLVKSPNYKNAMELRLTSPKGRRGIAGSESIMGKWSPKQFTIEADKSLKRKYAEWW